MILPESPDSHAWLPGLPSGPVGQPIDPKNFSLSYRLKINFAVNVALAREGRPVDFAFGPASMPVVSHRAKAILEDIAPADAYQFFPAVIGGSLGSHFVLNVLHTVVCVDEERSTIRWWGLHDGEPYKVGSYRDISRLYLRTERVPAGTQIFRVRGWEQSVIVSAVLRDAFTAAALSGLTFTAVT